MVAINPEMLRELLEEFTEKEEVTREEMNAINQQIAELEKRIESSKAKLAGLNKDRDKIIAMRERYLSGNWKLQLSNMAENHGAAAIHTGAQSSNNPVAAVPASAPAAEPATTPSVAAPTPAEGRAARRAAREAANAANQAQAPAAPTPVEAQAVPPVATAAEEQSAPAPTPDLAPAPASDVTPVVEAPPIDQPYVQDVSSQAVEPEQPYFEDEDTATFGVADQSDTAIEHAPPDDPIMSSFNMAASAPDLSSSFAQTVPVSAPAPAPAAEPAAELENSGFSWSSTAINAVEAAPSPVMSNPVVSAPAMPANPWGDPPQAVAAPPVDQRQSPADIWGHPEAVQTPPQTPPQTPSPAAPAAGGWGDFGEDWQIAEAQKATGNKIPTVTQPVSEPPAESTGGGWGQPASPWGSPQTPAADTGGGGWGRPTASRQNMPAMAPPGMLPGPAINPNPASSAPVEAPPVADAWGRSSQSTAGWGTQTSPWGDPAAQAQAPQAPQAPTPAPAPAPMQPTSFEQPPASEAAPSSLARAADGALISPVKGRRRSTGAPAAFDWGSSDSSGAADPNQAGGSEDPNDNKKIDDVLKGLFK